MAARAHRHLFRPSTNCYKLSEAIWVVGADRFRNPEADLPADFAPRRTQYYAALQQPEDAETFIAGVRHTMEQWLTRLNNGLPRNPKVILRSQGAKRIKMSPLEPQPDPPNVLRLK